MVRGTTVWVDGRVVASTTDGAADAGVHRIDGLFTALKARRVGEPGQRTATIAMEGDTPASVAKSVIQTTMFAGYPDVSLGTLP